MLRSIALNLSTSVGGWRCKVTPCTQIGLEMSLKGIKRALSETEKEGITYDEHGAVIAEHERRINDELISMCLSTYL
jgi:hypothetical protein